MKYDQRVNMTLRLTSAQLDTLDSTSKAWGVDRSTAMRAFLTVGAGHPHQIRDHLERLVEGR